MESACHQSTLSTLSPVATTTYLEQNVSNEVERQTSKILIAGHFQTGGQPFDPRVGNYPRLAITHQHTKSCSIDLTIAAVQEREQIQNRHRRKQS